MVRQLLNQFTKNSGINRIRQNYNNNYAVKGQGTGVGKRHNFHILPPSPWPMMMSINAPAFFIGLVMLMHITFGLSRIFEYLEKKINVIPSVFLGGLIGIFAIVAAWLDDVRIESYYVHAIKLVGGFGLYPVIKVTVKEAIGGTISLLLSGISLAISLVAKEEQTLKNLQKMAYTNYPPKIFKVQKNFSFFGLFLISLLVVNNLLQKKDQLDVKFNELTIENKSLTQEIEEKNHQIDNLKGIDISDIYFSYTYSDDFFLSYEFLNQNTYYCYIILSLNLIFFLLLTIYIYLSYIYKIFIKGKRT